MSNVADLRLNGLNPLSYQGVNPYTPVPFFTKSKAPSAPTVNDYQNFTLGTIWLDQVTQVVYMLVKLARTDAITTVATWVPFASGHANLQALQGNTGGLVYATGVNPPYINVVGDGTGITIVGNPSTNTLTASLVGGGTAVQSVVTDSGTATPNSSGVLNLVAGVSTQHCGSSVEFSAATNVITMNVTDANSNTLIGNLSGNGSISGSDNTALGTSTLHSIGSGAHNLALGYSSGSAYTSSESSNVLIANTGVVSESNTIHIGTQGSGSGQQNAAYMAGIYGSSVGSTTGTVIIDNTGKLGTIPYATGTFTPTITFGGNAVGVVYTNQIGEYVQIGNLVLINFELSLSSKGSSTGVVLINGFPKSGSGGAIHNHVYCTLTQGITLDSGYTGIGLAFTGTSANIEEYGSGVAFSDLTDAYISNNLIVAGTFTYYTPSP